MAFVQIIEFTTSRPDEIETLMNDWMSHTEGRRSALRSLTTVDRDRSNTYVSSASNANDHWRADRNADTMKIFWKGLAVCRRTL